MRNIFVGIFGIFAFAAGTHAIQSEIHRHRLVRGHHHCPGCVQGVSAPTVVVVGMAHHDGGGGGGGNPGGGASSYEFQSMDVSDKRGEVVMFTAKRRGAAVTWREGLGLWQTDDDFTEQFTDVLRASQFHAYFFECPPLTPGSLDDPFEFILRDSPALARIKRPDSGVFDEHLVSPVSVFPNLGGDAVLVAPKQEPTAPEDLPYAHLANFIRGAPPEQVRLLWAKVGKAMERRVAAEDHEGRPVWLSTSGLGVYWLHVRLDRTPKYYTYAPYIKPPQAS